MQRGVREAALILLSALALYLLVALASYSPVDPGWSRTGSGEIRNLGGPVGAWFADVALYLLGYMAYLFPVMVGFSGWLLYRGVTPQGTIDYRTLGLRWLGFLLTVVAGCGLATLHFQPEPGALPLSAGGVLGNLVGEGLADAFSFLGATLFLLALFLTGVTLFTGLSWLALMDRTGQITLLLIERARGLIEAWLAERRAREVRKARTEGVREEKKKAARRKKPPRIEPVVSKLEPGERVERERQVPLFDPPAESELPPLALLDDARHEEQGYSPEALEAMSRLVEMKLADFGIEVEVVAVQPGPVITRFELQPGPGVKVSQISNLAKDLARALSAISVRVVEVIPGKSVVGLEIPNEQRETVYFSEIVRSKAYEQSPSPLTLALGKDISGQPVVADLARMPHLLIAGATGAGKSVAINAFIASILFKATPDEVRLLMIDPKRIELSVYDNIPHLLHPVVVEPKMASRALIWAVREMERRYRLLEEKRVKSFDSYNRLAEEPLPYIVIIVDELADLMMVASKDVETSIARLAQMARAAGMHIILATQRPSVDVLTGLIKANFPTRISFKVSSKVDSRTILDGSGAEHLLGMGDMLFLPPGAAKLQRIHGAFISEQETERIIDFLREQGSAEYDESVLQSVEEEVAAEAEENADYDEKYDEAVAVVTETGQASISMVQRRLRVGYNRAARMIEMMEREGIVGPADGARPREVLVRSGYSETE